MDIVYLFRHSIREDKEIRYSLRSVARFMPFIRKVWIFGDRPSFVSENAKYIECVPWEDVAWIANARTPVKNFFLQSYLVAMHPEVDSEFLIASDDQIVITPVTEALARKERYVELLDEVKTRGKGLWREQLWNNYDWLKRLGYPGINFETHIPFYVNKKRVFEAYRDFRSFVSEERMYGFLGPTGILNHAYKTERFPIVCRNEEGLYAGFHEKPSAYADIVAKCKDKTFLNFDDIAFDEGMTQFLHELFPKPCIFEAAPQPIVASTPAVPFVVSSTSASIPTPVMA